MRTTALRVMTIAAAAVLVAAAAIAGQAAKVDVSGKWTFDVQTAAGSGTPTMTMKQEGEKLTGHYSGQLGESDFTGTVKGQDISFKFTVDAQGNMLDVSYTGTIQSKDAMKGTISIAGLGDGTWTAKKQ